VPVTALGLVFMAREGLTFGRAREMAAATPVPQPLQKGAR
jgi:hypothetical protein